MSVTCLVSFLDTWIPLVREQRTASLGLVGSTLILFVLGQCGLWPKAQTPDQNQAKPNQVAKLASLDEKRAKRGGKKERVEESLAKLFQTLAIIDKKNNKRKLQKSFWTIAVLQKAFLVSITPKRSV